MTIIFLLQKKNSLVHAVTGSGKTEMLFDLIAECMKEGKRACIATPRIDVVNELFHVFNQLLLKLKLVNTMVVNIKSQG